MLGITTLHNSMTLSTLSINSHDFALDFPKRPLTNGDVCSFPKLANVGLPLNNPQQNIYLSIYMYICIYMLGITTLHNSMTLSTLSINSHDFALL